MHVAIDSPAAISQPDDAPYLARRPYALETASVASFAVALAVIESGVLAVFAKQTFAGIVPERPLNFAVALLGSMDALANILSFAWSNLSHGRPKIPWINALQVGVLLCIAALSVAPRTPLGLVMLVACALAARTCWSGMITIRPTVWRANYPPATRASLVGRLSRLQVLIVAVVAAGLGLAADRGLSLFHLCSLIACAVGAYAVILTRRVRVRREGRLLRDERAGPRILPPWQGPLIVLQVLSRDRWYARFMAALFVLGLGNLMLTPIIAISLRERFQLEYFASILIASTLPAATQAFAIPLWAKMLDRSHVVHFRAIHSWVSVVACVLYILAAAFRRIEIAALGGVIQGIALGGGAVAWNLGHVDFSPPSQTSHYMATHVTLNGVRGLIAPFAAVGIYEFARAHRFPPDIAVYLTSLLITAIGAWMFVDLRRRMNPPARATAR